MLKKYDFIIHFAVMMLLFVVISMLPPFGMITPTGMKVLGAFVAIVYGWMFHDLFFASLFGFVLLGLTGIFTPTTAISAGFSNVTVQQILIVGAFAAGLNQLGLGELVANFMLSRKFIVGRPWILMIIFFLIATFFGLCGKGLFGILLLFSIAGDIAKKCGYEDKSPMVSFMFCMIVYLTQFMPCGFAPYLPTMLMFGGIYANAMQVAIPYGSVFVAGVILCIIVTVIMILFAKYVLRLDISNFTITEEQRQEFAKVESPIHAKVAFVGLMIFIALVVLPQFVGTAHPVLAAINDIGLSGWTIIFLSVFILWKNEEGKSMLNLTKMFANVPWQIVMLVAVTMPLGNAVGNAETGIMATMNVFVRPIMADMGLTGMYIFVFLFLTILTQFAHNFVAGAVFMPLFGTVGVSLGADPNLLFFLMFTALNVAYATPAASMCSAFAFGSEQIDRKYAYLWGVLLLVIASVVTLIGMPLWASLM